MQFSPNVVQCLNSLPTKFYDEIRRGVQTRVGWFRTSRCYISEAMVDRDLVTINHYRKSYMGFQLQEKSMTLNDLERQLTAVSLVLCVQ